MKKVVLFLFALAVSFSLSAQTVIFHFIVNMDSAQLGTINTICKRPFDTSTDNVELLGNYIDGWVSGDSAIYCTDPIVPNPIVDFTHLPNTILYSNTDTLTDSSQSNFEEFQVRARINHSWDNAETGQLEIQNRIIPVPPGTSEVTVQWIYGDTSQSSVILVYKMATGVKNITSVITSLSPNPATGKTTLTYTTSSVGDVEISIINLLGQKIRTVLNTQQTAGFHVQPINVSNLTSGIYFLNINVNGSTIAHKFSVLN